MKDTELTARAVEMTTDQYYEASESRTVITPENIGGLLEYPALFHAMQNDRELRPALSEAMSTGRAMVDFLSMSPEDFLEKYIVADGPTNPKTGKPYGTDTKAFVEWKAMQPKTPVPTQQFNMFGKMAQAYNTHKVIRGLADRTRTRNVILQANVCGVPCMCKIDNLYVRGDDAVAVDVKTTSDLCAFARAAKGLYYPEQQALIRLVLGANNMPADTYIAALEKGPMPRCGIFEVEGTAAEERVQTTLTAYSSSCVANVFLTGFEDMQLI